MVAKWLPKRFGSLTTLIYLRPIMELQGGIAPLPPDVASLEHEHSVDMHASGW